MAVKIANIEVSNESPLLLIAGTCVIENEALAQDVAGHIKEIAENLGISYVFKSSFDKANRTSIDSYRGPGICLLYTSPRPRDRGCSRMPSSA